MHQCSRSSSDAAPVKPQAPPAGEEPSFFDRLQDKISPPPPRPITPPPPPPPATLGDKISDFFSGNSEPKVAEHVAPPAPPKEESFLQKVTGTFADGQYGTTTAAPVPVQKEESIGDKISSMLGGKKTPPPPPPPKEESLADKIGGVFGGGKKTPPPPEDTGLVGHFQKLMGKEEVPVKEQTMGDKINSAFGGGAKGEKNEDLLDKGVFPHSHRSPSLGLPSFLPRP